MSSVIDRHVLPFVVALATTLGASTIAAQPAFEGVLTMKMSGVGIMAGGGQRDDAGGWRTAQAIVLHAGLSSRNQPANYYRDVVLAAAIEGVLQQRLTYLAG